MPFEELNNITKDLEKYQEEMQKKLQEAIRGPLTAALKELKKEFPTATKLYGYFYTPYFNDGDECVYGVHGLYIVTDKSKVEEDGEHEEGRDELGYLDEKIYSSHQISVGNLFCDHMDSIKEGLRVAFGDHQKLTFNLDVGEVTAEFWEHD